MTTPVQHTANCTFRHTSILDDTCDRCNHLIHQTIRYTRTRQTITRTHQS